MGRFRRGQEKCVPVMPFDPAWFELQWNDNSSIDPLATGSGGEIEARWRLHYAGIENFPGGKLFFENWATHLR